MNGKQHIYESKLRGLFDVAVDGSELFSLPPDGFLLTAICL